MTKAEKKIPLKRANLSDRDKAILQGKSNGKTSKEIGDELGLSSRYIEKILYNLTKDFGFESTTQLCSEALRNKIIK